MKKYLAIAMAALLLVCSLASCANGGSGSIGDYAPEPDYLITDAGTFYFEEGEGETAILVNYVGKKTAGDSVTVPSVFNDRVVTTIGERAFYNLSAVVEVKLPDTILEIGNYAFARCSGLTEITLPATVMTIGEGAFIECTSLTKVEFSDTLESIGDKAFYGCTSLAELDLPASLQTIGLGSFTFCKGLTSLEIPASVASIGEMAFTDCTSIESITFGSDATKIANFAFENEDGTNLKSKFVLEGLAEESNVLTYINSLSDATESESDAEEE